jgi:hypothetical protein
MRFIDPTTYEAWRSDLRWSYRLQLCCVFRVSHPLGALFRSVPFRPCFMPVTPLGFDVYSGFPPPVASLPLSRLALHVVTGAHVRRCDCRPTSRICASGESVSVDLGVTRSTTARSAPDIVPFEVLTSSALAPRHRGASVHGLRHSARRPKPPITMTALQRVKEPSS